MVIKIPIFFFFFFFFFFCVLSMFPMVLFFFYLQLNSFIFFKVFFCSLFFLEKKPVKIFFFSFIYRIQHSIFKRNTNTVTLLTICIKTQTCTARRYHLTRIIMGFSHKLISSIQCNSFISFI